MNSLGTTSIDSLPISPQTQNVDNNIRLETYDKPPPQQQMQQQQQQQQAPIYSPTVLPMQQLMQQQQQQPMMQAPPQQQQQQQQQADPTVAQRQLNQFVTGIQQASAAGMTALPSRDIPQNQEQLARDMQMRPNYVPNPADPNGTGDYIAYEDGPSVDDVLQRQQERDRHANHLDSVYDELQIPLFIAVLFFLFQLPVVRKQLLKYLPSLFNAEGNPTITGYMFNSGLFALTYYVLRRGMKFIEVE
jgi:hypothetical protein